MAVCEQGHGEKNAALVGTAPLCGAHAPDSWEHTRHVERGPHAHVQLVLLAPARLLRAGAREAAPLHVGPRGTHRLVVVVEEQKPRRGARAVEAEVASVVPPDPRVGLVDAVRGDEEDLRGACGAAPEEDMRLAGRQAELFACGARRTSVTPVSDPSTATYASRPDAQHARSG